MKKDELEQQSAEYLNNWKRALADYENLQKDLARQKTQMRVNMMEHVAQVVLPILDNFAMAYEHQPKEVSEECSQWMAGIGHIKTQYEQMIRDLGLQPITTEGKVDPTQHEVVETIEDQEKEDDTIVRVAQVGYTFNSTVIRPAKVVVVNNKKSNQ